MPKKTALPLAELLGFEASDKRIDILRRIAQVGSISQAARDAGVSYKAAWQALETLANLAGTPLVQKAVGGSGGGGAVLTAAGLLVLQAAEELALARQHVLARLAQKAPAGQAPALGQAAPLSAPSRAAMALRTSMRNQFPCTVGGVKPLAGRQGQLRVRLLMADGSSLHARITRESAQLLGLQRSLPLLALCKATGVQVARQLAAGASRNVLQGVVSRASRAAAGGEVTLRLPGGVQLVGFADAGHGLKAGQTACLAVDETGVVLASMGP